MPAVEASQITSSVLMVRPTGFARNEETAATNAFMHEAGGKVSPGPASAAVTVMTIRQRAMREFEAVAGALRAAGVRVAIDDDPALAELPDAVFPNNWFSTHALADGRRRLITCPMLAPSRRRERREHALETIARDLDASYSERLRFEGLEERGAFLEGTGSLVLDRVRGVAFAVRSPRTTETALAAWADATGYRVEAFEASSKGPRGEQQPIYHTNVMMALGEGLAIWCPECVAAADRPRVARELRASASEHLDISPAQMDAFAGNMLHLRAGDGDRILAMSSRAFASLDEGQQRLLAKFGRIVHTPIPMIEDIGGGGVRCMLAEIF